MCSKIQKTFWIIKGMGNQGLDNKGSTVIASKILILMAISMAISIAKFVLLLFYFVNAIKISYMVYHYKSQ